MEARDFIKSADRLCNYYKECVECPLFISGNCYWIDFGRKRFEENNKVIDIVEEWAKEHPVETRQDKMLKAFPNFPNHNLIGGVLNLCPQNFEKDFSLEFCNQKDCLECQEKYWLEEVE